jgi:hypothetical protein
VAVVVMLPITDKDTAVVIMTTTTLLVRPMS